VKKRFKKIDGVSKEKGFTTRFGPKKPKSVLSVGALHKGCCVKAWEMANAQGMSVRFWQCKMVFPLPDAEIREFIASVEQVIVAELNFAGQFNQILRAPFLGADDCSDQMRRVAFLRGRSFGEIESSHRRGKNRLSEPRSRAPRRNFMSHTTTDYKSDVKITWCPGCGDFAVLNALYQSAGHPRSRPKNVVVCLRDWLLWNVCPSL